MTAGLDDRSTIGLATAAPKTSGGILDEIAQLADIDAHRAPSGARASLARIQRIARPRRRSRIDFRNGVNNRLLPRISPDPRLPPEAVNEPTRTDPPRPIPPEDRERTLRICRGLLKRPPKSRTTRLQ